MRKLNICFCSQEFPPETHVGGIGTYTFNMATTLAKLGHTVHVIASTQSSGRTAYEQGVWVHRIKKRKIRPLEISQLLYSISVSKQIVSLGCQFDIIQASEYASEAFWLSFKDSTTLITRLATPYFLVEALNGKMSNRTRPFSNLMEKQQTLKSHGIFSSTRALAKKVAQEWKIDPSRIDVIPNSIDLARVRALAEAQPAPDVLKDKTFLVYFGRLEERKGVQVLARALPAVFKQFPSLHMAFVGADVGCNGMTMKQYIHDQCGQYRDRLIFFENQPHEHLFPIVNAAKLVILPSLWEAFGFVCVEAMALGRPVIASGGSGFEEIIQDNISGYLVEPGNSKRLSDSIISALRDEKRLHRISQGALKRAQDFEVSIIAHNLLGYYKKIIGQQQ